MSTGAYIGVSGTARKVTGAYIGVGDVARTITKAYVGVGGVARLFWSPEGGVTSKLTTTLTRNAGVLATGRINAMATAWSEGTQSIVLGGSTATSGTALKTAELFNGVAPTPITTRINRMHGGCAVVGSRAIFVGGMSSTSATAAITLIEAYQPDGTCTSTTATYGRVYPGVATATINSGSEVTSIVVAVGGGVLATPLELYTEDLTKTLGKSCPIMQGPGSTSTEIFALFGGGYYSTPRDAVIAVDLSGTQQALDALNIARGYPSAASVGETEYGYENAIFAGGRISSTVGSSAVDIYDGHSLEKIAAEPLSMTLHHMAEASSKSCAMFAHGVTDSGYSKRINFWDQELVTSFITSPQERADPVAATLNPMADKSSILIYGGMQESSATPLDSVDIVGVQYTE